MSLCLSWGHGIIVKVHHGEMSDHYGFSLGKHMRETVNINLGLLALKKCIDALNRGLPYVPYQDSKVKWFYVRFIRIF